MSRYLNPNCTGGNLLSATVILLISFSCENDSDLPCVKGKYLGQYCDGLIIKILSNHNIGRDWKSIFDGQLYENSVLANVDTVLTKNGHLSNIFVSVDSVFYFHYKEGGYARKQFSNCQPTASVTITLASNQPCLTDENN